MSDDQRFAKGGFIDGPATPVRLERVPDCRRGHPLWKIGGGLPEHVIGRTDPAVELLACQREVESEGWAR